MDDDTVFRVPADGMADETGGHKPGRTALPSCRTGGKKLVGDFSGRVFGRVGGISLPQAETDKDIVKYVPRDRGPAGCRDESAHGGGACPRIRRAVGAARVPVQHHLCHRVVGRTWQEGRYRPGASQLDKRVPDSLDRGRGGQSQ
ncbi:hypothetical protein [Streptomyces geranii]|uniref:hypothetical protein n=1 Tax=Streptomyces geranii TaxID=2058923 RepID=UPI000D0309A3|nr:hypothetical protein [Streptomyces geranii]